MLCLISRTLTFKTFMFLMSISCVDGVLCFVMRQVLGSPECQMTGQDCGSHAKVGDMLEFTFSKRTRKLFHDICYESVLKRRKFCSYNV